MREPLGERLVAATPILTMGLGLLALFAGVSWWWLVFAIGWMVVTPLVAILFDTDDDAEEWDHEAHQRDQSVERESTDSGSKQDALETLRDRYARGELSEEQFEAKLDRLLNTETLEDAREYASGGDEDSVTGPTDFDDVRSDRNRSEDRETEFET